MSFAIFYAIVIVLLETATFYVAYKAFKRKDKIGILLGLESVLVSISSNAYVLSALSKNYTTVKITSNFYFGAISLILPVFLIINMIFTKVKKTKLRITLCTIFAIYGILEFILFMINNAFAIVIDFIPSDYGTAPFFKYDMKIPYFFHLGFSYLVILIVFIELVSIIIKTPSGYKKIYGYVFGTLVGVIFVNAIFLFVPASLPFSRFDVSLPGYFALVIMIYWSNYYYKKSGMAYKYKEFIIDNVEEGYVLFDYEDKLILFNDNAKKMLINIDLKENLSHDVFAEKLNISAPIKKNNNRPFAFQLTLKNDTDSKTLRCTSSSLFNNKDEYIGYLYFFSNTEFENDVLTGFQSFNAFTKLAKKNNNFFTTDTILTIVDIDGLAIINATKGYSAGNEAIQMLSKLMRDKFPLNSYFIRGVEANLLVFSSQIDEMEAMKICSSIQEEFNYSLQYAVTIVSENDNLIQATDIVSQSLNTRKVLDKNSTRSNSLNSLIKALQEVDNDTLDHVKRTQELADQLAVRLGLNQVQRSDLSLLSMLHDIGKIAIPLEILNKPTKLTNEEWTVLKTHTSKGYNIAMSSPILKRLANEILHHHEHWDGNGYPDGLSKETIPLLSRIVSVVDSYDAMISNRPYRKRMKVSDAIQELKRCSGTQFDPRVVSEFIKIVENEKVNDSLIPEEETNIEAHNYKDENKSINSSVSYAKYIIDNGTIITSIDNKFTELTGYTEDDVKKGLLQLDLIPDEDKESYMELVSYLMTKSQTCFIEHKLVKKDGSKITVFCYGNKYYDSAVRDYRDEIIVFNVNNSLLLQEVIKSENSKANKRLESWEKLYRTDSLTGLLSHNAFQNDVSQRMLKGEYDYAFIMIDIDSFKDFNDNYGHNMGDKYLVYLAGQIVEHLVDNNDIVSRIGGDEFALLIQLRDNIHLDRFEDHIKRNFNKINTNLRNQFEGHVGISMGVSFTFGHIYSFDLLYENADKALYDIKRNGKENVGFYRNDS